LLTDPSYPFVQHMSNGEYRMPAQHSGAGKTHHIPDSRAHLDAVAVDNALVARRFILLKGTIFEFLGSVCSKLQAFGAQISFFPMQGTAIETYHCLDRAMVP
jgi:hypothetical protein